MIHGGILMKILIADDDELIVNLIKQNLALEGYETISAYDGEEAIEKVKKHIPDLIILDIMMPKKDGYQVCRQIKETGIPIVMLTAKTDISDKLIGLELGADDYIVKPFESRELIARIKAIFRRLEKLQANHKFAAAESQAKGQTCLQVLEDSRRVTIDTDEVKLTPKEYDLLLLLYKNPDRVFPRDEILDRVWGYDYFGDTRTVDIHVQRLRKKLGQEGELIETVFAIGYRFKGRENEAKK